MKHALTLPPFGALADPAALVEHATATSRIRIGPMVTPITRRRPIKLAREATTLDHLSRGRLTLGLGLGVDTSRELSGFGEITDARVRGQRLDEGVELLCALWTGEQVDFHGEHFVADSVIARPRPFQQPRVPLWFAARGGARKPVARAARFDGLFPIEVDGTHLAEMLDVVRSERGSLDGFDVMVHPSPDVPYRTLAERRVTWAVTGPAPGAADTLAMASTPPAEVFAEL